MDGGKKDISRREALKKIAAITGGLTVVAGSAKLGLDLRWDYDEKERKIDRWVKDVQMQGPHNDKKRVFPPDYEFKGEVHEYKEESARIIDVIKNRYGIKILSPLVWRDFWDESSITKENLPWSTKDIALAAEAISKLPSELKINDRSPKEILLIRTKGSRAQGAGGRQASRGLILYTAENFLPDEKLEDTAGKLYRDEGHHLFATVWHEFTHSFMEENPEILQKWIKEMGWRQDASGEWINDELKDLIHDGGADKNPNEDIAVSYSLMAINPQALSEKRKAFISKYLP